MVRSRQQVRVNNMPEQIFSVSEANQLINQTLEYAYTVIIIEGEVANYKISQNKWVFFDIKDNQTVLSCFMSIYQLNNPLEDGMLIRVKCSPKITNWGKFSLTVRSIELAGEGSVKKAFDILRAKLEKEGIFASERKRPLPEYPKNVALITSKQAAAYNDFLKILNDRWCGVNVNLLQVQVQGDAAPDQIVNAIQYFNNSNTKYDALVIIRGGGSAEDLQAFATESVTRAVYGSKIPTIVGIGHEDDVSLAELAADVRAATPTDAARLLVLDKKEMIVKVSSIISQQHSVISQKIDATTNKILVMERLFLNVLASANTLNNEIMNSITASMIRLYTRDMVRLEKTVARLTSLDPQSVLRRGYAVVMSEDVRIRSSAQLSVGQNIMIQLDKGKVGAEVKHLKH